MRKTFLLLTTALTLATTPFPAEAGFIIGGIAAAFTTISGWLAAGGMTGFLANTALSFAVSAVANKLAMKKASSQQDVFRELQQPDSAPAYRFVYGDGLAPGSPAPVRVKGDILYACFILNSRPSEGPFKVYLDKRELIPNPGDDPYNFNGPGVRASNHPFSWEDEPIAASHARYWISRGDMDRPPNTFINQAPEFFESSDGWQGRTVLWLRLRAGGKNSFSDRWPSAPPEVMVEGLWSRVWDPRDPSQNPNNESTWGFSNNYALCTLDALRRNPVRPYPLNHLWLDAFRWAADVADEPLPVLGGGTIPKGSCNGVLVFESGSEIEDQVSPLIACGAGRWIRAYGQLGILPAKYTEPAGTLSEVLSEEDFIFERWRDEDEIFTEAFATFSDKERFYEGATCPTYIIAGAEAEDNSGPRPLRLDLPFVTDHRQAQYVCKVEAMRTRMQKSISKVAPPEAINYLAGAIVNVDYPAPYTSRNGTYMIEESQPSSDPLGEVGGPVALRVPMVLRETSSAIYTWNPATEEKAMPLTDFDPEIHTLPRPASVSVVTGAEVAIQSGNAIFPQVEFTFPRGDSQRVSSFEWEIRVSPLPLWRAGGFIDREVGDATTVIGYTGPLNNGDTVRIRVRSTAGESASEWRESPDIVVSAGGSLAPPPTPTSAESVANGIRVTYQTPNNQNFSAIGIYAASNNNLNNAFRIFGPAYPGPNTEFTRVETGLVDQQTRYYWARSIDNRGIASAFSSVMSATYDAP